MIIYHQWGRNGFHLGEDRKKNFNLGEDLNQFFPNITIVFYKISKFRWGSILWFSPVPPSLPILRNKLQSHLVQKMVAIFSNLRALCNSRYQQPAREYSNHERNHDRQSILVSRKTNLSSIGWTNLKSKINVLTTWCPFAKRNHYFGIMSGVKICYLHFRYWQNMYCAQ